MDATLLPVTELNPAEQRFSAYEVNGEEAVPLPQGWFDGPRDERYGFTEGGYGRLWPEATKPAK